VHALHRLASLQIGGPSATDPQRLPQRIIHVVDRWPAYPSDGLGRALLRVLQAPELALCLRARQAIGFADIANRPNLAVELACGVPKLDRALSAGVLGSMSS
jgi:hypothetical protein